MYFIIPNIVNIELYIADQNIEYLIANAGIVWGYEELNNGLKFKCLIRVMAILILY